MPATLRRPACTPTTRNEAGPLATIRTEREQQLLRLAEDRHLIAEAEAPGTYLVRCPAERGIVQITTPFSCTCQGWRIWRSCEHVAYVRAAIRRNQHDINDELPMRVDNAA